MFQGIAVLWFILHIRIEGEDIGGYRKSTGGRLRRREKVKWGNLLDKEQNGEIHILLYWWVQDSPHVTYVVYTGMWVKGNNEEWWGCLALVLGCLSVENRSF